MQSAVAPMGAWVSQGEWAIVDTARSDIGRLITFNHKVLYCSETHSNSPSIEQVHWPENAFLPLHHRNFVEREFKSQRRTRRRQKMHGNDHVASVGLQDLNIVLRQNHVQPRGRSTPVRKISFTPILAFECSLRAEHTRACLALASWTPRRPGSILTRTESGGDPVPRRGYHFEEERLGGIVDPVDVGLVVGRGRHAVPLPIAPVARPSVGPRTPCAPGHSPRSQHQA